MGGMNGMGGMGGMNGMNGMNGMMQPPAVLAPHTLNSLSGNPLSDPTLPTVIATPTQQHAFRGPL